MNLKSSLHSLVGASLLAGAVFTMAPAMAVSSNDCVTSPLISTCVNVQTGSTVSGSGSGGGAGGGVFRITSGIDESLIKPVTNIVVKIVDFFQESRDK